MSDRPFRTYRLSELQSLAEKQIAGVYGPESDATTALHLALCARVLPGCLFAVCDLPQDNPAGHHMAGVRGPEVEEDAYGTTRALTILAAMLRALLALAGDTSGGVEKIDNSSCADSADAPAFGAAGDARRKSEGGS